MKIVDLVGNETEIDGCLGCELSNGNIQPFGGILYSGNGFYVSQDFELPISGFIIISSKRHVEKWIELTKSEQAELTSLINKTLTVLEKNKVAEEYNVVLEEKQGYHFHVWLMPRHKWMIESFGKVLKNIAAIQDYAIKNMRTKANFDEIERTCKLLKTELNKK